MYVHITPHGTCAAQALRCAEHIEAASLDPHRLLDAIRCAHLALMAAMVEALTGTAGIGAFSDKLAAEHLKFMRGERPDMPGERTLTYSELFERIQEPGRLDFSDALTFTEEEKHTMMGIDRLRVMIDHPKPTMWGVEAGELTSLLANFPPLLTKYVAAARHRYLDGPEANVRDALERIDRALAGVAR